MRTTTTSFAITLIAIAFVLTSSFMFQAMAQQSFTYLFSATPFNSTPSGGPQLEPIGPFTTPVNVTIPATTCPDTPSVNLTYFQTNSGFKARAFFTGSYSIEIIFKFVVLNGYNRIIDFSNSTSDYGIYTLNDCLNFYPTGNIGPCPGTFDTVNYKQIVITRNDTTKEMNVYVNGSLFTNYMDSMNYYVIGSAPDDSIKFFKDDAVVPGEASAGYVALIRMCNFILDQQAVLTSFNNFCTRISGINEAKDNMSFNVYPNPAKEKLNIQFSGADFSKEISFTVLNPIGQKILQLPLHNELTAVELGKLTPGVYVYHLQIDHAILKTGKIIIE